jgi:hypothetical protein
MSKSIESILGDAAEAYGGTDSYENDNFEVELSPNKVIVSSTKDQTINFLKECATSVKIEDEKETIKAFKREAATFKQESTKFKENEKYIENDNVAALLVKASEEQSDNEVDYSSFTVDQVLASADYDIDKKIKGEKKIIQQLNESDSDKESEAESFDDQIELNSQLIIACYRGSNHQISNLLRNGANPQAVDRHGWTGIN